MCPPAASPLADIALDVSNEEVFLLLKKIKHGSCLPGNVIDYINPYHYLPSNLPGDMWYFNNSQENKTTEYGIWKAEGEACELFSDSVITGWRNTLQFYEGQVPHERKTDWMMQKFWITQKEHGESRKTEETSSLCRIFLGGYQDTNPDELDTAEIQSSPTHLALPEDHSVAAIASVSAKEAKVEKRDETGRLAVARTHLNLPIENPPGFVNLSEGDYLELLDLETPVSPSSSSDNSSCMTMSSGEYFDSLDLMRDLESEINGNPVQKDEACKLNVSASRRPDELIMLPVSPGRYISIEQTEPAVEENLQTKHLTPAGSNNLEKLVSQQSVKNQRAGYRIEGPSSSSGHDKGAPSSSRAASAGKERKADKGKMKKLKRGYFCFMPF